MGQEFWANGGIPANVNVTDALGMLGAVRDASKPSTPALRGTTGVPGGGGPGMVTAMQSALKMNNSPQAPSTHNAYGGFVQGGWGLPHDRMMRYTPQEGMLLAGSGPGAIPLPENNPYPANPQTPGPIRPVDPTPVTPPPIGNGTITPPPGGGGTPPPGGGGTPPPPSVVTPIGGGTPITPGGGNNGGWGPSHTSIGSSRYPVYSEQSQYRPTEEQINDPEFGSMVPSTTSINGNVYEVNIPDGAGYETYLRTLLAAAGGGNGVQNVTPEAAAANPALLAGYGQTTPWEDWMLGTVTPVRGG